MFKKKKKKGYGRAALHQPIGKINGNEKELPSTRDKYRKDPSGITLGFHHCRSR